MKKIFITLVMVLTCIVTFAQSYVYSPSSPSKEVYYIDRQIAARHQQPKDETVLAGGVTRFGYAFNYDAFTYGASLFYQWNSVIGVTAGFDGYYIPRKRIERLEYCHDTIPSSLFAMPLWDIRAGLMISKYVMFGVVMGKSNVEDYPDLINLSKNMWHEDDQYNRMMYGGFVTLLLPISKHFGFNLDLAMTNKTGFNIGAGFNITVPIR